MNKRRTCGVKEKHSKLGSMALVVMIGLAMFVTDATSFRTAVFAQDDVASETETTQESSDQTLSPSAKDLEEQIPDQFKPDDFEMCCKKRWVMHSVSAQLEDGTPVEFMFSRRFDSQFDELVRQGRFRTSDEEIGEKSFTRAAGEFA